MSFEGRGTKYDNSVTKKDLGVGEYPSSKKNFKGKGQEPQMKTNGQAFDKRSTGVVDKGIV